MTSMYQPFQSFGNYTYNGCTNTVKAERKSAAEVLKETKPLYVKSSAVLKHTSQDKHTDNIVSTKFSCHRKQERSCELESKLRRLLNSRESLGEDFCYTTEVQYKSLPDLSTSSYESFGSTLHHNFYIDVQTSLKSESSSSTDTGCSSSSKSYGKPPSLSKSFTSMGGSVGKVESKIWKRGQSLKKSELIRSKSDPGEARKSLEENSVPPKLEEFFQYLGMSSQSYRNLTGLSSSGSGGIFFSSESSTCSSPKGRGSGGDQENVTDMGLSIVERNARVIKWIVACAKS